MIKLELPELPYDKSFLEPYMSSETLELHHDKHHLAYVTNGNKFIEEQGLSEFKYIITEPGVGLRFLKIY